MAVNVTGSFNFNIIQMHKIEWNCIAIHNCDSKCLIFAYFFKSRISVWVDLVFLKKKKSLFSRAEMHIGLSNKWEWKFSCWFNPNVRRTYWNDFFFFFKFSCFVWTKTFWKKLHCSYFLTISKSNHVKDWED